MHIRIVHIVHYLSRRLLSYDRKRVSVYIIESHVLQSAQDIVVRLRELTIIVITMMVITTMTLTMTMSIAIK